MTSNKSKFKWNNVKKDAFDEVKQIVACSNLLICTDFNETFKIHTGASKFQLGSSISQKRKSIAFYGIKLMCSQKRYAVKKIDLLKYHQNLKEFRTILLGQRLIIYTFH